MRRIAVWFAAAALAAAAGCEGSSTANGGSSGQDTVGGGEVHADGTAGGTDGTADGTDGTADGTDGTVDGTDGTVDGTDGTVDGTDGTVDGTDGTADGTDGTADGTDGTADGTDGTADGTDGTADGTDGTADGTDGSVPTDACGGCGVGQACDVTGCTAAATKSCAAVPDVCPEVSAPVCGCDEKTYSNNCERLKAGVAWSHDGECAGGGDGCAQGTPCDEGQVCDIKGCGEVSTSTCVEGPIGGCPKMYAPVCGCNGQTFDNDCFRLIAGVAWKSDGACDEGGACGIWAGECPKGQFCDYGPDDFCGFADAPGTCQPIPDVCPDVIDPVCGCNSTTYDNECLAHQAGVAVSSPGPCDGGDPGKVCGPIPDGACGKGEVCDVQGCGLGALGTCEPAPGDFCPALYQPQCGCDGKTYSNSCERLNAGVGLDYEGECGTNAATCGGFAGFACAKGEVCDLDGCYPDAAGTCIVKPDICPKNYLPECGCDNVTYGNECERQKAGVGKDHDGACK